MTSESEQWSFLSLTLEPDSEVLFSTDEYPAIVSVLESFTYRGKFTLVGEAPAEVLITYLGTSPAWVQAPYRGTLVAPNTAIEVSPTGTTPHIGSFMGREIVLHADARLVHVPFSWKDIDDLQTDLNSKREPPSDEPTGTLGGMPPLQNPSNVPGFLDWYYLSLQGDLPALAEATEQVRGDNAIAQALIDQFQAVREEDMIKARMALGLLGALRSSLGESFFVELLAEDIPLTGTELEKDMILEAKKVLAYQQKAVHGLAVMFSPSADAELKRLAKDHPALAMRAEAVRAYIINQPSSVKVQVEVRPGEEFLLDRFENNDFAQGGDVAFNASLAAFAAKYPSRFE